MSLEGRILDTDTDPLNLGKYTSGELQTFSERQKDNYVKFLESTGRETYVKGYLTEVGLRWDIEFSGVINTSESSS